LAGGDRSGGYYDQTVFLVQRCDLTNHIVKHSFVEATIIFSDHASAKLDDDQVIHGCLVST
jgi:hypothetical protein